MTYGLVQHESMIQLDGATGIDRGSSYIWRGCGHAQMLEQLAQLQLQWAIDDYAKRTFGIVVADQCHGVREIGICEFWHCDQKVVRKFRVAHGGCHGG